MLERSSKTLIFSCSLRSYIENHGSVEILLMMISGGGLGRPPNPPPQHDRSRTADPSSWSSILPSPPHRHPGGPGAEFPAKEEGRRVSHVSPTQEVGVSTEPKITDFQRAGGTPDGAKISDLRWLAPQPKRPFQRVSTKPQERYYSSI